MKKSRKKKRKQAWQTAYRTIPVLVNYREAEVLDEAIGGIIVSHAGSGECFSFDSNRWTDGANVGTRKEFVERLGLGGMDDEFYFIWLNILSG